MSTAVQLWHVLQSRAIEQGIFGIPSAPARLIDVDSTVFFAFVEGIVRNDEENAKAIDKIYDEAKRKQQRITAPEKSAAERQAEIDSFTRLVFG